MTNDAQWHDLNGHEWMDSAAFSKYEGHTVDLDTQDGFGEFSYDNFFDVMKSHPTLDGFWIDNDNQYWLDHNLYQQIYQLHPNMTISNNNEDTPIMDMISNEQKTGMTPAYDMPQAYYTALPRLTEADYKLPSTGAWWYDGSNSTVDYGLNIGRYIANAGNSVLSLMAETAQVNGKFPSNQVNFNNFMQTYLPPIWESIGGTYGGGYMYGGMPGGAFDNGAYGYTTISKSNPNLQYIHVVTKPTRAARSSVRDNGYAVSKVTNLRTGANVSFTQGSGFLTLSGISSWDQYDTVFKVQMSGRTGIDHRRHRHGQPLGQRPRGQQPDRRLVPELLGQRRHARRSTSRSTRARRSTSRTWRSTSVRTPSRRPRPRRTGSRGTRSRRATTTARGRRSRRVPCPTPGARSSSTSVQSARYVRLVVNSLYGSSKHAAHRRGVAGDGLRAGRQHHAADHPSPTPSPTVSADDPPTGPANRFEAESGTCDGTIDSNHLNFSGTGFCNTTNAVGSTLSLPVTVPSAGSYNLTVHYANGTTSDRPMSIAVNGTTVAASQSFPVTANWDTWVGRDGHREPRTPVATRCCSPAPRPAADRTSTTWTSTPRPPRPVPRGSRRSRVPATAPSTPTTPGSPVPGSATRPTPWARR